MQPSLVNRRRVVSLAACFAGLPRWTVAQQAESPQGQLDSAQARLRVDDSRRSNDDSIVSGAIPVTADEPVYYHQSSGGSVAAALLFGAIGAAVNRRNILANTTSQAGALGPLQRISVRSAVTAALAKVGPVKAPAKSPEISLSPFVLISRSKDDRIFVRCAIDASASAWIGRYTAHVPFTKTFDELTQGVTDEELSILQRGIDHGFEEAVRLLAMDLNGSLPPRKAVLVRSPQVTLHPIPTKMWLLSEDHGQLLIWGSGGGDSRTFPYTGYHSLSANAVPELTAREEVQTFQPRER